MEGIWASLICLVDPWMWKKTHGWKEKLLSRGGKAILIKLILQAIPFYAMSVFKLPLSLCQEFLSLIRKF